MTIPFNKEKPKEAGLGQELQPEFYESKCSTDPRAPHGFDRTASHNAGRYVCDCEGWEPEPQRPIAWMDSDGNFCDHNDFGDAFPIPLYTGPYFGLDLTKDEINQVWLTIPEASKVEDVFLFADALIAKFREKNS